MKYSVRWFLTVASLARKAEAVSSSAGDNRYALTTVFFTAMHLPSSLLSFVRKTPDSSAVLVHPRLAGLWRVPALVLLLGCILVLGDAWFEWQQYDYHRTQRAGIQARLLASDLEARIKDLHSCLILLAFTAGNSARPDVSEMQEAVRAMAEQGMGAASEEIYLVTDAGGETRITAPASSLEKTSSADRHLISVTHALAGGQRLTGRLNLAVWMLAQETRLHETPKIRVSGVRRNGQQQLLFDSAPEVRTQPILRATVGSDADWRWDLEAWPSAPEEGFFRPGVRQAFMVCALLALASFFWVLGRRRLGAEKAAWQATQDVERSRDRWMRALEATQDGVWEFDAKSKHLFASQMCLELAGVDPASNKPFRAFLKQIGKEQRRRAVSAMRAAWDEASRLDELLVVSAGTTSKRWLRIRGSVTKGRAYFTGALSDVTEEIELARERDRYQSFMAGVIDALPMPMSVKAADGTLILVNKLHAQSLNKMMSDLVGKRANQLVGSKMAEQLEMLDRLVLETGRTHSLEDWFDIALARRRVFLRITKSRCQDENGKPVVVTTYEDQTEVRSYARRLADLNVKVQSFVERLIETIPHPVYVKDSESRYLIVNAGLADQWGMRVEDMVGRSSRELFGNERGAAIEEEDRRVLAGEVVRKQDSIFHARSAQLRHWAVTKRSCVDVDGRQVIVGSNYELTEMRRAELDLRAALDQQTRMRAFLQETFDALPHPLFIKDRKHRYLMTNRAHAAFHNCTRDRIIGAISV